MTDRAAEQEAREIMERLFERMQFRSAAVYSEEWGEEIIAAALQRRDDELARMREELEALKAQHAIERLRAPTSKVLSCGHRDDEWIVLKAQVQALREALADAPDMTCESLEACAWREKYAHLLAAPPTPAGEEGRDR